MPPACFGSPTAVSHLCETCRSCVAASACVSQAISLLESFRVTPLLQRERQRLSLFSQVVTDAPRGRQIPDTPTRTGLTAKQEAVVSGLGSAAGSMARQLFQKGWFSFAKSEMRAGRNPGRNDWQRILCAALMDGGTSRTALQVSYQEQLNLTPGSARVRVSKAVTVFLAGGLLYESNGKLQLSQN